VSAIASRPEKASTGHAVSAPLSVRGGLVETAGSAAKAVALRAKTAQGMLVAAVLLFGGVLSIAKADFLTVANAAVLAQAVTVSAIVAFAQMIVLGAGGMDLSIGGIGAISAVISGGLMTHFHVNAVAAIAVSVVTAGLCGVANGWLIVLTRLSPFIVTLATGSVFTGVALGLTNSNPIVGLPSSFNRIGTQTIAGIPAQFYFLVVLGVLLFSLFRYVGMGRQILAVGANQHAAELAGVSLRRIRITAHGMAAVLAGIAGVILAATLAESDPTIGSTWLLSSFAAPIIGGTPLTGGYVSVFGAGLGSLLLAQVQDGLVYLQANIYWLQFFSGTIIIATMALDRLRDLRAKKARRPLASDRADTTDDLIDWAKAVEVDEHRTLDDGQTGPVSAGEPAMSLTNVSKRFGGTQALDAVSFSVNSGEIHALLGENGAGKSTLIKIIAGVQAADQGDYHLSGTRIHPTTPRDAAAMGVAVVHQERSLVPSFTVGENVMLSDVVGRSLALVNAKRLYRAARMHMAEVGLTVDPDSSVRLLSPGQRQLVEIARSLSSRSRVLLLDEPTASLSLSEVRRLVGTVRRLRDSGVAVVYVTHKLEEVFELCDRVSVLRDGRNVGATQRIGELTKERLIELMVGRHRSAADVLPTNSEEAPVALEAEAVRGPTLRSPASFRLHTGEVLGWYGLVGAGRTELARVLVGADHRSGGSLRINGLNVGPLTVAKALRRWRFVYVSENRQEEGLFLMLSILRNSTVTVWSKLRRRTGLIDSRREREVAERYQQLLQIRAPSVATTVSELSGGNQQKVSVSKWLAIEPAIIVFDEPTVGIDVRTKSEIHGLIRELAGRGTSVIVISSDLQEIIDVTDRVLVFRNGAIVESVANTHDAEEMSETIISAALGTMDSTSMSR